LALSSERRHPSAILARYLQVAPQQLSTRRKTRALRDVEDTDGGSARDCKRPRLSVDSALVTLPAASNCRLLPLSNTSYGVLSADVQQEIALMRAPVRVDELLIVQPAWTNRRIERMPSGWSSVFCLMTSEPRICARDPTPTVSTEDASNELGIENIAGTPGTLTYVQDGVTATT
jgi:hypothetical protein